MNLRGKTELHERLAAEYALGTLRGGARRRFERWMREDAAIALAAARWQERLAPMQAAVAPVAPPARVWRSIRERLDARGGSQREAAGGFWDNLAFWRGLGLAASGAAAALLAATVVLAPRAPDPAPAPVVLRVPSEGMPNAYLAVLSDAKTQKPVLVVSAGVKSDQLWVKTLDPAIHVPDKSLELWALPQGGAPKSLGLVSTEDKGALRLAAAADQSLGDVPALAVSLEPKGGSTTGAPTGPVLFTGPCIKFW
jgi:anti-sigma-K factor RskA